MSGFHVSLFGKLIIRHDERILTCLDAYKVQELLCYLLLHRNHPHSREALATLFAGEVTRLASRKQLRQTIWQLQSALSKHGDVQEESLLLTDSDWIQINPQANLWLDVAVFEQAYAQTLNVAGRDLTHIEMQAISDAVDLYQGDLLEGWYQDWCLYAREWLQSKYLVMLDKLMEYSEACGKYEAGLEYGARSLRADPARECTHYRIMQLFYLAGDRTSALRQYKLCVDALHKELDVEPTRRTMALYHQLQSDRFPEPDMPWIDTSLLTQSTTYSLTEAIDRIKYLQAALTDILIKVQQDIAAVEQIVTSND